MWLDIGFKACIEKIIGSWEQEIPYIENNSQIWFFNKGKTSGEDIKKWHFKANNIILEEIEVDEQLVIQWGS